MNILILGATGQLGRHVTHEALTAGHQVTAFARNPHSLHIDHENLDHFSGDACNANDVDAAVAGHDAVIVVLGTGKSRKNTVRSDGTRNVIEAMNQHGVTRLVCQTTLGCQETWDMLNFYWKRVMFGALIRPVFKDHERQERLVQASDLDWTIVRPSAFRDKAGSGELLIDFPSSQEGLDFTIATKEIATFIVKEVEKGTFVRRAVSISR